MSKYFQILNRLERERNASVPAESLPERESSHRDTGGPSPDPRPSIMPFPELPLARRRSAYGRLLDNLRARVTDSKLPCFVVAGITVGDPVDVVVSGLTAQANELGLDLQVGELTISEGRRILRDRRAPGDGPASAAGQEPTSATSASAAALDFRGKSEQQVLEQWLSQKSGIDFSLVVGPPLCDSVETALVAKGSAGLVLVVQPLVTPRRALKSAVDKATETGCRILGLVMSGTREELPRWLRNLIDK